jgi:calcium-binding protein CML
MSGEGVQPFSAQEVQQFNEALYGFLYRHEDHRLAELFNLFDRNKNGVISGDEIKVVLEQIAGHGFSDEQVSRLVKTVDENGDGVVDIHEFSHIMRRFND